MTPASLVGITVILGATGLGSVGWAVVAFSRGSASRFWPTVEGTVVYSAIDVEPNSNPHDGEMAHRSPVVRVRYEIGGTERVCDRLQAAGAISAITTREMEDVVKRFPAGSKVKVYYNPANPSYSVLQSGSPMGVISFIALFGAACLACAAWTVEAVMRTLAGG